MRKFAKCLQTRNIFLCHLEQIFRGVAAYINAAYTCQFEENACNLYAAKPSPMCCLIGGKTVHNKWEHLLNNSHTELWKMNASQCGDPDASRNKRENDWR